MAELTIQCFGYPTLICDQAPITIDERKTLALLVYLAVTGEQHSREALSLLLWPEYDQSRAAAHLRRALWMLRRAGLDGWLNADRQTIGLRAGYRLDVIDFRHALAADCPAEAAQLYRGDFLAGLSLRDAPDFDDWRFFEAEQLRQVYAGALEELATRQCTAGEYDAALVTARRLVALDPLHEPAQRTLMQIYAAAGQPAAALRQYQECARILAAELAVEPDPETTALFEQLKQERSAGAIAVPAAAAPRHNLPVQATPFLGRTQELAAIDALAADPAVRLITICGPGGMGKTRLALAAAEHLLARPASSARAFPAGAWFVPLAELTAPAQIVPALATALGLQLNIGSGQPPLEQLITYLQRRRLLLVLDNVEHLLDINEDARLPDAAELIATLLAGAPDLLIVATSRERLHLHEEHLLTLQGLELPAGNEATETAAVKLFAQAARRTVPDFQVDAADRAAIVTVCRLVAGMPLAIELAAAWTALLTPGDIAAEITRSLDLLATDARNVPQRQRSIRAVCDAAWQRLAASDQAIYARLAVFQGGFTRQAAAEVAGATLPVLNRLAEASLLTYDRTRDRYQIHELLRQYAAERLSADASTAQRVRRSHAEYYLAMLTERNGDLSGGRQLAAAAEVAAEGANLQVAWSYALATKLPLGDGVVFEALVSFCFIQGAHQHALELTESLLAVQRRSNDSYLNPTALGRLYGVLAWCYIRSGLPDKAGAALASCDTLYARHQLQPSTSQAADPLAIRGVLALVKGDYAAAARLGTAARERAEQLQLTGSLPFAWYVLTGAAIAQGQYRAAQEYARRALVAAEDAGNRWFQAYCLNELGIIADALADYPAARRYLQQSYALRAEFADPQGMAIALNLLGRVALHQADYPAAHRHYSASVAIYRDLGDRGGLAGALYGLGLTLHRTGDHAAGCAHLREALTIAAGMHFAPLVLDILTGIAECLLAADAAERATTLLVPLLAHPASNRETSNRALALLGTAEANLSADRFAAATEAGRAVPLDRLVEQARGWVWQQT